MLGMFNNLNAGTVNIAGVNENATATINFGDEINFGGGPNFTTNPGLNIEHQIINPHITIEPEISVTFLPNSRISPHTTYTMRSGSSISFTRMNEETGENDIVAIYTNNTLEILDINHEDMMILIGDNIAPQP